MKWVLAVLLVLVFGSSTSATVYVPVRSILPIQQVTEDGTVNNACTSFSINEAQGLWLTAAHCEFEGAQLTGEIIDWKYRDTPHDLVIFEAKSAPALRLAIKAPAVGDPVYVVGYPHGSLDPLVFFGRVSSPFARLTEELSGTILNLLALPGNSGSPIFDASGRVIGVGQMSNQTGVAWGVPWQVIREFTLPYWK